MAVVTAVYVKGVRKLIGSAAQRARWPGIFATPGELIENLNTLTVRIQAGTVGLEAANEQAASQLKELLARFAFLENKVFFGTERETLIPGVGGVAIQTFRPIRELAVARGLDLQAPVLQWMTDGLSDDEIAHLLDRMWRIDRDRNLDILAGDEES